MRRFAVVLLCWFLNLNLAPAQSTGVPNQPGSSCSIEATNYKGWSTQQLSNRWIKLEVVPQNGGRLMQVIFAGHSFLFVNSKYEGKYLPPDPSRWFNYGGDKLWLLPEGNDDEQHWVGNSDLIDDGPYVFRKVSEGRECEIELTGPPDPQTGIQIRRTIHLDADSPRIRFHATMQNKTGHMIEWSMQSVSQYDTADHSDPARSNSNFWTFTPANPFSSYLNRYHVRFGPAENPAVSVRDDGLFALHYVHMAAELWLDSTTGWLAVVDGDGRYAMVERFRYEKNETYPGKASVIFWTNGPEMRLNAEGEPSLTAGGDGVPRYLEAEINSPLVELRPHVAGGLVRPGHEPANGRRTSRPGLVVLGWSVRPRLHPAGRQPHGPQHGARQPELYGVRPGVPVGTGYRLRVLQGRTAYAVGPVAASQRHRGGRMRPDPEPSSGQSPSSKPWWRRDP